MTDFQRTRQLLIDSNPELEEIITNLIIHYNGECKRALIDLYYAVPPQDNDKDWWPDELTDAMANAFKIIT